MNTFKRPLIGFVVLLTLLVGLAACAAEAPVRKSVAPAPMPALEKAPASEVIREQPTSDETTLPELPRRIIYEADMTLVVTDTQQAAQNITSIAEALGGYVASANLYRANEQLAGSMTVRVPQERFDEALQQFRSLAVRVDQESIRTNDVTQEYVDLQARLKNLEATEEELRALLTEVRKRTQRASDVLEVYRELTRVREEIEQTKGRLQMLDKLTTLATINIQLTPYELSQPVRSRWDPRVTLHRAWGTLLRWLQVLVDVTIYLVVVVLPILVLILLPVSIVVYLIRWRIRRSRRKKPPTT